MHGRTLGLIVLSTLIIGGAWADDMGMNMDGPKEYHPINAGSKTFHWILSLFLLLILPSISALLAIADRLHWSLVLQFISTGYSVLESIALDFPDPDGHENKTSKGTSWFLSLLFGATVFVGTLVNGSNLVMNKFYPSVAKKAQQSSTLYNIGYKTYRGLSVVGVLTAWVRMCLAPVALFGFCYGDHTGQCIAHGIMGSSFVAYGFLLTMVLVVPWIRKHPNPRLSQEFYDSSIMMVWGIVNTFTEHRWGSEWNHGDYQHTSMGIIWWAGGLLGMWQTRNKDTRSFVPALLLCYTGWAMLEHHQHLVISTKVHAFFGTALMGAGFSRIVEILFLLWDKHCSSLSEDIRGKIYSFQYFPPFCLVLSGLLFMGATEEQLELVEGLGTDHSAYIMVLGASAFVIYLWFQLIISFYLRLVGYDEDGELNKLDVAYERAAAQEFELSDLSDTEHDTPIEG